MLALAAVQQIGSRRSKVSKPLTGCEQSATPVTFCIKARAPSRSLDASIWEPFCGFECIKIGARNFRAKPAACEWTESAGSSRRRRSQCGNGKNFVKDYFKYPCCYSNNRNFLMVSRISVFAAVKAANMLPCSPPRITLIFYQLSRLHKIGNGPTFFPAFG